MRVQQNAELIGRADELLRAPSIEPKEALALAKKLIRALQFGRARLILERARFEVDAEGRRKLRPSSDAELALRLGQKHVLSTYKDPDLPAKERLEQAWALLVAADDPDARREADLRGTRETWLRQESLGLAGAICKRLWQVDNARPRLEQALAYYLRGHELGCESDAGYTGINAAFVADQLAWIEEQAEGSPAAGIQQRRSLASNIRTHLLDVLPAHETDEGNAGTWWFPATLAEACFGLRRFDEAERWARKCASQQETPEWERESTARQLATLARLLRLDEAITVEEFIASPPGAVLRALLGGDEAAVAAVASAWIGRVGLALSGGGFRASLFHIGVLARLAELDVLRHVEVLSCVSGGSVLGAHYYLELRRVLRKNEDGQVGQEKYLEIVRNLEQKFLAGVQQNLRTRVVANLWDDLRMLFSESYSRTTRLAELYERHLYERVADDEGHAKRWLGGVPGTSGLHLTPKGCEKDFHPKRDNWRRRNKVPILLLNATTLNTGHTWQFSGSWMGEPPPSEIDGNDVLPRKYYDEPLASPVRLGLAVAASSCVPGLFEPVSLPHLYEGRTVRLVDGGVHDNQGVAALTEQDCDVVLVSDASGQMDSLKNPQRGPLGVSLRSNSILIARVRDAQFEDLKARRRSGLLRGMLFLHMKEGLDRETVPWLGRVDPQAAVPRPTPPAETSYGVRKDVQALLAGIRTDLDSFSEVEAYALMTSGHAMASTLIREHMAGFPVHEHAGGWTFLQVREAMQGGKGYRELKRQLAVASKSALKVWYLSRPLYVLGHVLAVAALVLLGWLAHLGWNTQFFAVRWCVSAAFAMAVTFTIGAWAKDLIWARDAILRRAVMAAAMVLLWGLSWLHIGIFDPLFLRIGKAKNLVD